MKGWVKWSPFLLFLLAGFPLTGSIQGLLRGLGEAVTWDLARYFLNGVGSFIDVALGALIMQALHYATGWKFRFPFGGE